MDTRTSLIALTAALLFSVVGGAADSDDLTHMPDARMLRFPDVSAESIVFSYAGDLWVVTREGGTARRLS